MKMFIQHPTRYLAAYADGRMAPEQKRRAESHLARCGRCRAELAEVRSGMAMMEHLPLVAAPDSVWLSIEEALERTGPARKPPRLAWGLAMAAALLVATGLGIRFAGRAKPGWEVVRLEGQPSVSSARLEGTGRVRVEEWVETDSRSRARIRVGGIGTVIVEPETRVRVAAAGAREHRLELASGTIHADITAPPRLFFVETPAGTAVDLGCKYELRCDREGNGLLRVTAGWVSYEWKGRESLVPAGAVCVTRAGRGPGTPYFEDAAEPWVRALERFESGEAGMLDVLTRQARVRDTLTLWHLLTRVAPEDRRAVYARMAELSPPPDDASRERILALDADALRRWKEELAWTW